MLCLGSHATVVSSNEQPVEISVSLNVSHVEGRGTAHRNIEGAKDILQKRDV